MILLIWNLLYAKTLRWVIWFKELEDFGKLDGQQKVKANVAEPE